MFDIQKYHIDFEKIWDDFVLNKSFNGTIYHTRKFLNYHSSDKFKDRSILIKQIDKNDLIAVLPCVELENGSFFSHIGSTYGGPIIINEVKLIILKELINTIFEYYYHNLSMRISNDIYLDESQSDLIYFISKKSKLNLELGYYINNFNEKNIRNKDNLRQFRRFKKNDCFRVNITNINNDYSDYLNFYQILENNLINRHNTNPTHSLDEFIKISKLFIDNHILCLAKIDDIIISGIYLIEVRPQKFYTIYIAQDFNYSPKERSGSLINILDHIFQKIDNIKLIDLGIVTEDKGNTLNLGLGNYKQTSLMGKPTYRYLFESLSS